MDLENIRQIDGDKVRKFLLSSFELKIKLGALNSEIMAKQLENYIKNYANSTAENFGRDLKKYLHSEEAISGETIRNIISKVKEKNDPFIISNERTRIFLKLFNIIADKSIKEKNNYSLKNKLSIDFYKYPGDNELNSYIENNNLSDSYTSDSLLEYIISKHEDVSKKICEKFQPRIIQKQLKMTGKILKKYEWNIRYSDNLFEQQSIVEDQDFNEIYLPKNVDSIFTGIDENIIMFMSNHIRFLRLVSRHNTPQEFADILGIGKTSLVQYETTHHKLDDSIICNLVDYYSKEQDKKYRLLFDYFFTEISCPKFSNDNELRRKFSELIDDYTFLKYNKFQHDNSEKKTEPGKKTVRTDVRQETIDLLECEIKWFVLQTIFDKDCSGVTIESFLAGLQTIFDKNCSDITIKSFFYSLFSACF